MTEASTRIAASLASSDDEHMLSSKPCFLRNLTVLNPRHDTVFSKLDDGGSDAANNAIT